MARRKDSGHIINLEDYRENGFELPKSFDDLEDSFGDLNAEKSDDLLFKAYDANTKAQAIKYAKEALKLNPNNIDAENVIIEYEDDSIKRLEMRKEVLKKAENKLKKDGYFDKEYIGDFYLILETRPYMRTLHSYTLNLVELGRYTEAIKMAETMLTLCKSDNTGIRYLLIVLYVFLEKYKECDKLLKKFHEVDSMVVFPEAIMYYKKGEYDKCIDTLKVLHKSNKHIIKMLIEDSDDATNINYYASGSREEASIAINTSFLLLASTPLFVEFVDKHKTEIRSTKK